MKTASLATFALLSLVLGCSKAPSEEILQNTPSETGKTVEVSLVNDKIDSLLVETITIDLNNDSVADTIQLRNPPADGDPGIYGTVMIALSNGTKKAFTAKDIWASVDEDFLKEHKNGVSSPNVFVFKQPKQTILVLFGFHYGSGREELTVIGIQENDVRLVFNEPYDYLLKLEDLDKDGKNELIVRNAHEMFGVVDSLKAEIGVYSPYLIYTLDKESRLNQELSESYNRENYVFAGLKYNEKIRVLYPWNGDKPRILE
ncbi:hypothetical protein [Pontibacter sp. SGAir0037]|uniref:hypothetical protein n=1 Tax=Pontibacter sp. SGAir0037 TaxID=2571030 RepID=UPI0010CD3050|nr:hypothetical protein [Pontibacter sp. SGAir0037]QCR21637.1 hypothetical protein C1N53_04270 [Pontibacter sp. SGAir0037]